MLAKIYGAVGTWLSILASDVNNTLYAYTDSNGQVKFPIDIGTIPGNLVIEVRPTDQSSETLQHVDLSRVDPIGTIHVHAADRRPEPRPRDPC